MVEWRELKVDDWIVCPAKGKPERITESRSSPGGRWFVRAVGVDRVGDIHDRPRGDLIEKVADPTTSD